MQFQFWAAILILVVLFVALVSPIVVQAQQEVVGPDAAAELIRQLESDVPRGRLLDLSGRPIAGAVVRSVNRDPAAGLAGNPDPDLDPTIPAEVRKALRLARTSNAAGEFFLIPQDGDDFEPGRVTLRIETPDQGVFEVNSQSGQTFDVHVPTCLSAKSPELKNVGPSDLAGLVVDEHGQPLEGVQVDVWTWFPGHEVVTGKDGIFHLKRVQRDPPTEGIQVRFSKPGYSPEMFFSQPVGTSRWVVALSNKTWVEGVVTLDGRAVIARVRADQGPKVLDGGIASSLFTETFSDAEGRFKLLVQPDRYSFHVVAHGLGVARPEPLNVEFGKHPKLDVVLAPGASLELKAIDSETNQPVPNLKIFRWEDKSFDFRTNEQGMLTISDLIPGELEVEVEGDGRARWRSEEAANPWSRKAPGTPGNVFQRNFDGLSFKLESGQIRSATVVVERDVVITGRILSPDGHPVAGATAAPALTGSGNSLTGDTRFSVETNADGKFEMRLPASHRSKYNLVAHDGKFEEWRNWANGVLPPIQTVPGQRIENVELRLTRGGSVRGKVVDRDGRPCPRVQVRAQASDKFENRYYDPTATTADDGSFEIRFIRPGEHEIQSLVHADGALYVSDPAAVTVKAGQAVNAIVVRHRATIEQLSGGAVRPADVDNQP